MRELPILFSPSEVVSIRRGDLRRTIRPLTKYAIKSIDIGCALGECFPIHDARSENCSYIKEYSQYGVEGDVLWVKEKWRENSVKNCECINACRCEPLIEPQYYADVFDDNQLWRPSIHMPRKYSRLLLKINSIRLKRVWLLNDGDALVRGFSDDLLEPGSDEFKLSPMERMRKHWIEKYGPNVKRDFGWDIEFELLNFNTHVNDRIVEGGVCVA